MTRRGTVALAAATVLLIAAVAVVLRPGDTERQSAEEVRRMPSDVGEPVAADMADSHVDGIPMSVEQPHVQDPTTSAGAPSPKTGEPARAVHFSGFAVDQAGAPLAGHTIEVYSLSGTGNEARKLEAHVLTNSSGRFRIDGLVPGPKLVVVCGPGEGDIWGTRPDASGYHSQREERDVMLGIPETGADDFVLKGGDHAGVLVTARVVDDLGRAVESWWFELVDEMDREGHLMNIQGQLSGIVPVHADGEFELQQYSWPHRREFDVLPRTRYVPLPVHLTRGSDRIDLGTLVLSRMAGVRLTLTDATNGVAIGDADVRLACSGGGQPPAEVRGEMDEQGVYALWSGRAAGEFTLDVKAAGYQPVQRIGVLVAGDEPQRLELVLERTR